MSELCAADLKSPPSSVGATVLEQQFRSSPYWSLRQLICVVDRGRVIVRGRLPSYYLKQVAQALAVKTVGVERIRSEIEVRSE
jgi:BON domain